MTQRSTRNILSRLSRIEGQIKGVRRMTEEGRPCEEILLQIKAVQSALRRVGIMLTSEHIDKCILEAISEGKGEEAVESLKETLTRSLEM